jgi:hypothetical protein
MTFPAIAEEAGATVPAIANILLYVFSDIYISFANTQYYCCGKGGGHVASVLVITLLSWS